MNPLLSTKGHTTNTNLIEGKNTKFKHYARHILQFPGYEIGNENQNAPYKRV